MNVNVAFLISERLKHIDSFIFKRIYGFTSCPNTIFPSSVEDYHKIIDNLNTQEMNTVSWNLNNIPLPDSQFFRKIKGFYLKTSILKFIENCQDYSFEEVFPVNHELTHLTINIETDKPNDIIEHNDFYTHMFSAYVPFNARLVNEIENNILFRKLEYLDINNCIIHNNLTIDLSPFVELRYLRIGVNNITIPTTLSKLTHLSYNLWSDTVVDLSLYPKLVYLDASFSRVIIPDNLIHLETLCIVECPETIVIPSTLTKLKYLSCGDTDVDIPDELTQLCYINVLSNVTNGNYILPETCIDVTHINISQTSVSIIPDTFINLKILDCSFNFKIMNISNTFTQLTHLDICETNIEHLPDTLVNLTHLKAQYSKILSVPKTFTKLTHLDIRGTHVTKLHDTYPLLKYLDISITYITELPVNMSLLEYLDIKHTSISGLPKSSIQIKYLYCHKTPIAYIPSTYTDLEILVCNKTFIYYIPKTFTKIRTLQCNNTTIDDIQYFTNLEYLKCSNTNITHIPDTHTKLKRIECINFHYIHIPFEKLKNLKDVYCESINNINYKNNISTKIYYVNRKYAYGHTSVTWKLYI